MSRQGTQPATVPLVALTPAQAERVRIALRSAAGEYAELTAEELEERIAPYMDRYGNVIN